MPRYCLPKEHGAKVFELLQVTNDGATMQHRPILLPAENIQVALHDLKKWRVSKQGMPAVLPEAMLAKAFPTEHALALEEFQKAQVVVALRECYEKHSCQDQEVLAFATNPQALFARTTIPAKKLRLVPLGPVSKVKADQAKTSKLTIQAFGADWAISSWKQDMDQGCVVPFHWCKPCLAHAANMHWIQAKLGPATIPLLQNHVRIPAGIMILCQPQADVEEEPAPSAKKKAKKSN